MSAPMSSDCNRDTRTSVPKEQNTRQSGRTGGSNAGLPVGAECQSRVSFFFGYVHSDVSCVVSERDLVFSAFRGDWCGNQFLNTAHLRTHVVASWPELAQQSCAPALVSPTTSSYATWYAVGAMSLTFLDMSSEQRSAAAPLEPSLEALFREVNFHDEILMVFQVQDIVDRGLFVALDSTEEGIRKTAQEAFLYLALHRGSHLSGTLEIEFGFLIVDIAPDLLEPRFVFLFASRSKIFCILALVFSVSVVSGRPCRASRP